MTDNGAFPVPHTGIGERGTRNPDQRVDRGSKLLFDIKALLSGGIPEPPRPLVLTRDDGNAIFYAGMVNSLFGEPESGKTIIAQAAISELAKANSRTVFIDIDHNGPESIVSRLISMGVAEDYLADPDRFRYFEPEDKQQLVDLVAFLGVWRPALAVVDSVGELLPLFGLNSNSPDDFTTVHATVLKPLATAGAAVVIIDHLAKNTDSKAAGPTGTAAKRRAISGVAIRVKVNEQFVPGNGGSAWITVNKDRHGGLRMHCPRGEREPSAGLFQLTSHGERLTWNLRASSSSDAAEILDVFRADLAALDELDPPPTSVRDIKERLHWRSEKAADVLRVWRSRSQHVPGEQGTDDGAERSPFPHPYMGNGEQPDQVQKPCGHPGSPSPSGRCGTCIAEARNAKGGAA